MGTVLTNPFELNFGGLAARNAENIKEAEDPTDSDYYGTVDTFAPQVVILLIQSSHK